MDVPLSQSEIEAARRFAESDSQKLAVITTDGEVTPLPAEVSALIAKTLRALATADQVKIGVLPEELTSNAAAELLGVSRPTLLKMAKGGRIKSHQVGSHTRFERADVLALKAQREHERQAAFAEMREIRDQLDGATA